MTRDETIKWLESLKVEIGKPEHRALWHYAESIDVAIKALSKPKGEWVDQDKGAFYPYECSICHEPPICDDDGYILTNFCPNCGTRMKDGEIE